jgi:crossover junction endodeoxyribonuclease RuvC
MRVLGVDPGLSGAYVLMDDGVPIEWDVMPTMVEGSHNRVNAASLAAQWRDMRIDIAFVEQVGAMPGQGVTSMFSFGHSAGVVRGVLGALEIPTRLVTPQAWKKHVNLLNKDKDAARSMAIQFWPEWRELDKKGRGQALADAALIALYATAK